MFHVSEMMTTPPPEYQSELQRKVYETFSRLGIPFERVDTDPGITMEDCRHIDERTGVLVGATTILSAVLLLICMEALHFYTVRFGERQTEVVLSSDKPEALMDAIQALGKQVGQCSWLREGDRFKADISMLVKKKDFPLAFLQRLKKLKDVQVDAID